MRSAELISERNQAIRNRFAKLYEVERLRLDDVFASLRKEFFLSQTTIERILRESDARDTGRDSRND